MATTSPSSLSLAFPGIGFASSRNGSIRSHWALFAKGHGSEWGRVIRAAGRPREFEGAVHSVERRKVIGMLLGVTSLFPSGPFRLDAQAAGLPPEEKPKLCDAACEKELENVPMVTTASGLQYKDITVGTGPSPPVGYQVAANYVAMVPSGQIFDSSLDKGLAYLFRVGSGQVIKGLDEGILTMKVGGKRRLFIPGPLAFPKGLVSAPGRPRVAANSPVVFDVSLEYIPGLEVDDEERGRNAWVGIAGVSSNTETIHSFSTASLHHTSLRIGRPFVLLHTDFLGLAELLACLCLYKDRNILNPHPIL